MQWIMNADDFGASPEVNAAIARAYREGVLTSASLMVGGVACREAVALAREMPGLAVGLHLVLADGRAVLPPARVPHLVDVEGRLRATPLKAGLAYALRPAARREVVEEITAQFERFAATGLALSHVDGHCHLHLHPAAFPTVVRLARRYGARGIRVPRDDLRLALALDGRGAVRKLAWTATFGLLGRWARRKLRGSGLATVERTYGFMQTGRVDEAFLIGLVERGNAATAEVYCHPTTGPRRAALGPNRGDLAALLSAAVRERMAERGIERVQYADLGGTTAPQKPPALPGGRNAADAGSTNDPPAEPGALKAVAGGTHG